MKKIVSISIILLGLMFHSCKKTDAEINYSTLILGKWTLENVVQWHTPVSGRPIQKDTARVDTTFWDFRSGSGNNLYITTINYPIPTDSTGEYLLQGNKILYGNSYMGGSGNYIQSINANKMVWYQTYGDTSGYYQNWWNFSK